jgi:hypothetical protein
MTSGQLFGIWINYRTGFDLIKWYGGKDFNWLENTLTRMCGFYFFINTFTFASILWLYAYDSLSKNYFS